MAYIHGIANFLLPPAAGSTTGPEDQVFCEKLNFSLDKTFLGLYFCTHVEQSTLIHGDYPAINPELFFCLILEYCSCSIAESATLLNRIRMIT